MIISNNQRINLGFVGSISACVVNDKAAIELVKNNPVKENVTVDMISRNYRKYTVDQDYYYVFEKSDGIDIYKSMPLVHNDNIYHWEQRTVRNRIKNLWCSVKMGKFRFNIMVYLSSNDVHINICDDSHLGNPFEHIWLRNSSGNKEITEAITNWYDHFLTCAMASKNEWDNAIKQ